jgi:hypothetical protein
MLTNAVEQRRIIASRSAHSGLLDVGKSPATESRRLGHRLSNKIPREKSAMYVLGQQNLVLITR